MVLLILAISLFISSDSVEVKGTRGIFYRAFVDKSNLYFQYKAGKHWSKPTILDSGNCFSPSIAITPGDYIHIVWQRDVEDGKIFYKTTLEKVNPEDIRQGIPPNWSSEVRISEWMYWPPTEPASNPFVEAYGEYVYAAWRGPNENGEFPGDIWRRKRHLERPYWWWEEPYNKSDTRENESNYPVMHTNFVTVWQEQVDATNWDIWARFEPDQSSQPLFQTEKPSKFPHIEGYWHPKLEPPTFFCNCIWTEGPPYQVNFGRYRYQYLPSPPDKNEGLLYYVVEVGNPEPSPYCLERDGYLTQGTYTLDYGDENLKYKLPYLNPQYDYLIRAIVYRTGICNWLEDVYVDSTLTASILSEPYQPETIWINIPKEFYKYDAEIEKEIEKIIGRRALIADLRIYQVESIDSISGSIGPQSTGNALIQRPVLYQSFPNPAKMRTVIRYSLPAAGKVSLQLYDISGRLVKTLVDEFQNAGNYLLALNPITLSTGVYFYRLKTNGFCDTKRLVLIR